MNTLHLKYAVEVERTGSITQAAENLYMGQPALSKNIKELEKSLGITIFKRTSKGVVPTKKGASFLVHAKNILSQVEAMESLYKKDSSESQSLSISIPSGSYITKAITQLIETLDKDKETDIIFKETNSLEAIENIVDGDCNLGIIRYQTTYEKYFLDLLSEKKIKSMPIHEFEYYLLMNKAHPLSDAKEIMQSELREYIEIVYEDLYIPYLSSNTINVPKEPENSKKNIYVYSCGCHLDVLSNIPSTYTWSTHLPEHILNQYNLIQRKCKFRNEKYKDVLIFHNKYEFTPLDEVFIDKLLETKKE